MSNLTGVMEQYFIQYASYVILDRAIPDLRDGLKPVQRRILATLFDMDDGKFIKVANVVGETMKLHPHGDASIGDALVYLANKELFIEKQGNFGNQITGDKAAAPRYIECRLNDLAKKTLFNKELTEYVPSYDGRKQEPVFLPVKLPLILTMGAEGIAVGMATYILPHNLIELLKAEIATLKCECYNLAPDFYCGGLIDVSEYNDGLGKVRIRARIDKKDDKTVVISEIPFGTTTESLIKSIEDAAQKGKIKISGINDFTGEKVSIEVSLPRAVHADEVIQQLYAYTDCEVTLHSNITVIKDAHPEVMSVHQVIDFLTNQLKDQVRDELLLEQGHLLDRQHWLTLEKIFIENRIYKRIEEAKTDAAVHQEVTDGMNEFSHLFYRPLTQDDVERLLKLEIRRISRYDMNKNRRDMEAIALRLEEIKLQLDDLVVTTINYIQNLIDTYKDAFPRRTEVTSFEVVDRRKVARASLKASFDPEKGYFGTGVKGPEFNMALSEYDRVLVIFKNGTYKVLNQDAKIYLGTEVYHIERLDPENGLRYLVVYKDLNNIYYAKRVHIKSFTVGKEYHLIKDDLGSMMLLMPGDTQGTLNLRLKLQSKRQRITKQVVDLINIPEVGPSSRGARLSSKPISKMVYQEPKPGDNAAAAKNSAVPVPNTGDGQAIGAEVGDEILKEPVEILPEEPDFGDDEEEGSNQQELFPFI